MGKFKDLSGEKFNKITILKLVGKNKYGKYVYLCKCDCGKEFEVCGNAVKSGNTKSCGCIKLNNHRKTHGMCNTRFYRTWYTMKRRCYDKNISPNGKRYEFKNRTQFAKNHELNRNSIKHCLDGSKKHIKVGLLNMLIKIKILKRHNIDFCIIT